MTISHMSTRKCWDAEFHFALIDLAGDTFPQADYELNGPDPHVTYSKVNKLGVEILKRSAPFNKRKPPRSEIARVQKQIERIHEKANDIGIPADRREFFRNLQLPNPWYMPECWRTTGFFRKHLYIIWGLDKDVGISGHSTFLPVSKTSGAWDDTKNRVPIDQALGMSPHSNSSNVGEGKSHPHSYKVDGGRRDGLIKSILRWLLAALILALITYFVVSLVRGCDSENMYENNGVFESPVEPSDIHGVSGENDDQLADEDKGGTLNNEEKTFQPQTGGQSFTPSEAIKAMKYRFKVNEPQEISKQDDGKAAVLFSVSPIDDLHGKTFVISDWEVNGEVKKSGLSSNFAPEGGLRYDKTYTITAKVTMDGKLQSVLPYQWNMIDDPTWQILEVDRGDNDKRRYKVVCSNSSSIKPVVKDWQITFRPGGKNEKGKLDFDFEQKCIDEDILELDWGIGHYKGTYFLEMTAAVQYDRRGKKTNVTHSEIFPFSHDSSVDGLTRAKYEVVAPCVYFCLAKLEDGSLINGTAFAISEKLLLSNYHVAVAGIPESYANSRSYNVVGPVTLTNNQGKKFYAKVDQHDRGRDLVLLKICDKDGEECDDRLPGYLHLSEDGLAIGLNEKSPRYVFAVGYPKGTVCLGPPAFTDGKTERVIKRDYIRDGKMYSYDTILNYTSMKCGYSGGPLIDYSTETVLGVNFGGFVKQLEGHKAGSLATSVVEIRRAFQRLKGKR